MAGSCLIFCTSLSDLSLFEFQSFISVYVQGSYIEFWSWILEKVFKFAQQFSKAWIKPGKYRSSLERIGKKSWFFFSWKLHQVLDKWNCFHFGHILNVWSQWILKRSFVPAFSKVYIEHLFDNPESGKRNYCFGKRSGKNLEFSVQKSLRTLHVGFLVYSDTKYFYFQLTNVFFNGV